MSDLWLLLRYVHSKFHELSDRGTRHGTRGNGTIPAVYSERIKLAKHAGMAVMDMYRKNIRPRDIMTKDAILNALTVDMALGCSTNSMLHLPAIAHEIGFDFDIAFANPISEKTPNLCHLAPAGPTYMGRLKRGRRCLCRYERTCRHWFTEYRLHDCDRKDSRRKILPMR